jgi:alpha-galactosidase
MDKKIALFGAGSAVFGPVSLSDIFLSKILPGSTITLVDIDEEKLNMIYEIINHENKLRGEIYNIEKTTDLKTGVKDADFVVLSIEHGDRFKYRWIDHRIPHSYGTTELMAENGGPGGFFHSARQIPECIKIAKAAFQVNPNVFLINYSNPMSRICLAISRAVPDLNLVGLCHQIHLLLPDLPYILNDNLQPNKLENLTAEEKKKYRRETYKHTKITVGGLNHFAFILGLTDMRTGQDLLPKFNARCWDFYQGKWDRFKYADLTFEIYKRFGWFPYVGDNHICEYVQFGSNHAKYEDLDDWINMMEDGKTRTNKKYQRYYKRLLKGKYPRKGILMTSPSGERAIPIIEEVIEDKKTHEIAVNILNKGIIENLPQDLVIECSGTVDKDGVYGIKLGKIPKNIAALLRIEASIQDVCVEAILKESKDLAITCIAMDVNCGNFEVAEKIYKEMLKLQGEYLPNFK